MTTEPHDLKTLRVAARFVGCRPGTLRQAINRKRLTGYRRGRDWWVSIRDVLHYMETRWYGADRSANGRRKVSTL